MWSKLRSIVAGFWFLLACAAPAAAAGPADDLKAQIDDLLGKLETFSHGMLKWEGADRLDIRQDGDAAIADITNARISFGPPKGKPDSGRARIDLDHIDVRYAPAPDDAMALSVVLPPSLVLHADDGDEVKFTLTNAELKTILDAKSLRARETTLAFAGARIDDKKSGDWLTFGPLSASYKLVRGADGGWQAPFDVEQKTIDFFFTEGPVGGQIERITYHARSAGPDIDALNRMRDRIDALRRDGDASPDKRVDELLDLLPDLLSLFQSAQGELGIEGVAARAGLGEPLLTLGKASFGGTLTGLSGESAALRITLKHDGLKLAASVVDPGQVPHRIVLDIGLEDIGTAALRHIFEAAKGMRPGADDETKNRATQEVLAAAAALHPVLHIHELALDTETVGLDVTGEARGSPLSAQGYTAEIDLLVRGFDALPGLVGDAPPAPYLPVLKELGTAASAPDGTPQLKFHLVSTLQKPVTLNGNDVGAWLAGDDHGEQPRRLRPADPPVTGPDVVAVQRALATAKVQAPQSGSYDGATAAAVARFQKQQGLNVDGVVDQATRQKLGLKPGPPPPLRSR